MSPSPEHEGMSLAIAHTYDTISQDQTDVTYTLQEKRASTWNEM